MYGGYVTILKNVRPHPNADRLKLANCFSNTVVVDADSEEGEIGVYFPIGGQLSIDFLTTNNLMVKKDDSGKNIGGRLDPISRKICAERIRGEQSDGLFCPLSTFEKFCNLDDLKVGDKINSLNGVEICCDYISKPQDNHMSKPQIQPSQITAPLFLRHHSTEQLVFNHEAFKVGDVIELSLKLHGTSQRTAYLPVFREQKRTTLERIFHKPPTVTSKWEYISGTRNTILPKVLSPKEYFRSYYVDLFQDKLFKGETVYYEVVGYSNSGAAIMGTGLNKKLDEDFIKQYGKSTVFSYGCGYYQSDIYVYRMTLTNEDGDKVEYSPSQIRERCLQMNVKCPPIFSTFIITEEAEKEAGSAGQYVQNMCELFYDGPDPIGKTHVREGVVVRIVNSPTFRAYKHKNFSFKVLSGIIKTEIEET